MTSLRFSLLLVFLSLLGCPSEQVVVRDVPGECGNGELEVDEECDDGNEVATDDCTDGCKLPQCGDGITRQSDDPKLPTMKNVMMATAMSMTSA